MDPTVVQRLVLCKYTFFRGKNELNKNSEISDWEAVKDFHDALETFMVTIADAVGVTKRTVRYHEYPGEIKSQTGIEFIHGKIVDEINDLRTPYKHHAIYPNAKAVRQLAPLLEIVFEQNTRQYLHASFNNITLGEMVEDPQIRNEVKSAEAAIESGDFRAALEALKAAFIQQTDLFRKSWLPFRALHLAELPRELFDVRAVEQIVGGPDAVRFAAQLRRANQAYEQMKERLDILGLGINFADYMRFNAVTPTIHFTEGGNRHVYVTDSSPLIQNKSNCEFCMHFLLETVLRLQSSFRIYDTWSRYTVRVRQRTPLLSFENGDLKEVSWLDAGQELQGVHSTLVLAESRSLGYFWRWQSGKDTRYLSMDVCEIIEEIPPGAA